MLPLCYSLQLLFCHILQRTAEAMLNATRLNPPPKSLNAKIALPGHLFHLVKEHGSVGAGVDTQLAPVAFLFIHKDSAILSLSDGVHRTGSHTQRVIAVHAQGREEIEMELILNLSRFNGHHLAPLRTGFIGEVMFLPAGNLTSMATDTAIEYD
jgi:hypothetical protein